AKVDAVTMVYQVGKVARGALRRAKSQIDNAKVDVVGVVLNCLKPESKGAYGQHYGYAYSYGSETAQKPWYTRWLKIPNTGKKLLKHLKRENGPGRILKGNGSLKSNTKGLFRTFILITSIVCVLFGLLWQFGIIMM
ncbi:MAG: CpsD/CapB family tyrosine-protein kinase, partial [Planctomycetes bacterium]|nr:CpsD/CapB family tyrosine-protein kinase [Planctomycetota bacterium]